MSKTKTDTRKTCIAIKESNMKTLENWSERTGLPKNRIIDLLIENAVKNKVKLEVTYELSE